MQVLYHASPLKNLKIIQPKKTLSRDIYIGDYVFATSNIRLAAMYLATKGIAILLNVKSPKPTIVIRSNPREYISNDKGGAIYAVSDRTFKKSPQEGLEDSEMVSGVSVKPISRQVYSSSLDAMKEKGIVIYFVDEKVFNDIVEAKDESKILKKLNPYN